ncbi:MAG: sulfotransferase, partial [Bacteroidales bacterium]|nr:sulfotransferase [Bacteroidales bacterium]
IIGLQRTGTTKLHRMLASDPDTRALLSWEAINPSPMNGDLKTGAERIKMAKMSEKALKVMSPGFFAIHPVEHLAPEEDVLLLDVSFLSTTAEATMHVPSYSAWLEKTEQSSAYEYAAKLMKFLQWQRPAKQWVLKTPHHLEFLDLAEKYFEDVQFIWTHRNVQEAIPSFLSMVAYSRVLFSNEVDSNEVAQHWVKKIGYMLNRAMEYRDKNNHIKRFIDISYQELVKDSHTVMERVYGNRNMEITDELKQIFVNSEQINPKGKYGIHKYKLADFSIDADFIDKHTREYQLFQEELQ